MTYKNFSTSIAVAGLISAVTIISPLTGVFADGTYGAGCTSVYGGGVNCPRVGQVLINKTVKNPSTGIFVDNLGPADPKYRTQEVVTFQITVKNSGDQSMDSVTVKDTLPQYVDFMTGPGTYDANSKVLTFTVNNLDAGSTQTFEVKGRTTHPAVLPADKNVICPVNVADAQSGDQKDHDEAQFCIEKKPEVPMVPKAGPEMTALFSLAGSLLTGLFIKKKINV